MRHDFVVAAWEIGTKILADRGQQDTIEFRVPSGPGEHVCTEDTPLKPASPYAASKAGMVALTRARALERIRASLLSRQLLIGVDRLDYSKGLVQRFRAYERFLETHPENHNRVTFMQIAPLSRTDVRAYSEIRRELDQVTGRLRNASDELAIVDEVWWKTRKTRRWRVRASWKRRHAPMHGANGRHSWIAGTSR